MEKVCESQDDSQSQSFLKDLDKHFMPPPRNDGTRADLETDSQSQSLLKNANNSEDLFKSYDNIEVSNSTPDEDTQSQSLLANMNVEFQMDSKTLADDSEATAENTNVNMTEDPQPMDSENIEEIQEEQNMDEDNEDQPEEDQIEDEPEDEETEESSIKTTLPVGRVKKIMQICLATYDENEVQEDNPKGKKKSKKGAKESAKTGPVRMIVSKEAIYLTTVATELFVQIIIQRAGKITTATKKKTMSLDHLRIALSDAGECMEFLQGFHNPSFLIGD